MRAKYPSRRERSLPRKEERAEAGTISQEGAVTLAKVAFEVATERSPT